MIRYDKEGDSGEQWESVSDDDDDGDDDGAHRAHRVGPECEVFARRDQIRIADKPNTVMVQMKRQRYHEDVRRYRTHPQYRFIRGVSEIGIPELLEFRSEFGQFGWLGSPLDPGAETAVSIVNEKEMSSGRSWCSAYL